MKLMIWGLGCGFRAREPRGDPPHPSPSAPPFRAGPRSPTSPAVSSSPEASLLNQRQLPAAPRLPPSGVALSGLVASAHRSVCLECVLTLECVRVTFSAP